MRSQLNKRLLAALLLSRLAKMAEFALPARVATILAQVLSCTQAFTGSIWKRLVADPVLSPRIGKGVGQCRDGLKQDFVFLYPVCTSGDSWLRFSAWAHDPSEFVCSLL